MTSNPHPVYIDNVDVEKNAARARTPICHIQSPFAFFQRDPTDSSRTGALQ